MHIAARRHQAGGPAAGKRPALAVLVLAAWPLLAPGQLALELSLPSFNALVFEPVNGVVTLRNNSGRALSFDAGPDSARLSFGVELGQGRLIEPARAGPILADGSVAPGATRSMEFNISRLYAMNRLGRYRIQAQVEWRGVTYVSAPVFLEVVKGSELARLKTGVPGDAQALRTYVLEYLQKDTTEEHIYLRIEDESAGEIYGLFNLGRVVRVRPPDLQVDESGNAHVLFQTPGMGYTHAVFSPYGTCLSVESHAGGARNVDLTRSPDGNVTVNSAASRAPTPAAPDRAEGPVTEIKKKAGGLIGKFME